MYGYTEPTKQKLLVGEGVGQISFTAQSSCNSPSYSNFVSGLTVEKNLAFNTSGCGSSNGGGGSIDGAPPVITLLGANLINLYVGNTYIDAGATASDNADGNITTNIVVVNPVNTAIAGTYTVTYNISDATGNVATEVTRTVIVSAVVVPDTTAPAPSPSNSSGGRSGGGGSRSVIPTSLPVSGLVLGSSAYNFTLNLSLGSTGNDVTELQNHLTTEGVYTGPITGYFGPLTGAGVKAYQLKYGIEQVGIVGPATRARLNQGSGAVLGAQTLMTIEQMKTLLTQLQAQVAVLLLQLKSLSR
jgi:hypothetical protein